MWFERYIGQPYSRPGNDCVGFAIRVAQDLGKPTPVDAFDRAGGLRAWSAQIMARADEFAERTEHPEDGDPVLMIHNGRAAHIGVFVMAGEPCVMHACEQAGQVVMMRSRNAEGLGYRVEGYYKWKP